MKTTSVRVDVPDSLYEILVSDQEKRRQSSGKKKPSLSSIILEYCGKNNKNVPADQNNDHYEQRVVHPEHNNVRHEQKKVHHNQKSIQNNVQPEQNTSVIPNSSLPDTGIEKRLKHWEEHLSRWEASLREKETMLKEKEEDLFDQKEEVYQMKIDLLEQKDNYRQETLAGPEKIIESRMLSYDLEHKNKKISELEERLKDAELKYHKAQKQAETIKETPSFLDQIKEYWPLILAVLGILGAYLFNHKKDKTKLDPQLETIAKILGKLDPKEKESLGKAILDLVNNFQKENTEEKKNEK